MTGIKSRTRHLLGYIAIVGRLNVGKSTLLNKILGQKSRLHLARAQTTRHRIVGIKRTASTKRIYVDAPGLHIEEKRAINRLMNRAASSAIGDLDPIIVVDGAIGMLMMKWFKQIT